MLMAPRLGPVNREIALRTCPVARSSSSAPYPFSDDSLDSSYGIGGKQSINFRGLAEDLAVAPDGSVVVVGYDSNTDANGNSPNSFAIARLTPSGMPDNSFGINGKQNVNFGSWDDRANSVIIQPDGRILVAGDARFQNGSEGHFGVARLTTTGQLDSSFGDGGKQIITFGTSVSEWATGVAVQSDGKIVVSGTSVQDGVTYYDFAVARLDTSGQLDTSFATGGKATINIGGPGTADYVDAIANRIKSIDNYKTELLQLN